MDLNQLITFQRLARQRSFSHTANFLNISQPTVTVRIKKLEEQLGEQLVKRVGEYITLTDAGEEFLLHTNRTLRIYIATQRISAKFNKKPNSTLRLASISSVATYLLPDFLSCWYDKYPNTLITVQSGLEEDVICAIEDGIADVGIIRGPMSDPAFQTDLLYYEPVHLVVGKKCSLTEESHPIPIRRLANEPLMTYNSHTGRQIAEKIFYHTGFKLRVASELDSSIIVKKMVQSGFGMAFLPSSTIRTDIMDQSLFVIPVSGISPIKLSAYAITANLSETSLPIPNSPLLKIFLRELKDFCRNGI